MERGGVWREGPVECRLSTTRFVFWAGVAATIVAAIALAGASGCGFGDQTLADLNPEAAPLHPETVADIQPILEHYCVSCHSQDAPAWQSVGPYLDDPSRVETEACRIYRSIETVGYMPPGVMDRPTESELLTLENWVRDRVGDPANCGGRGGD